VTKDVAGLTRIYGEHLFLFTRDLPDEVVLLTVYPIPGELKSAAHQAPRPGRLISPPALLLTTRSPLLTTSLQMKPTIRAENDSMRFTFADHTAELQSRAGAWFSARLAELQEPLRALVAQRLFIHHEGDALQLRLRRHRLRQARRRHGRLHSHCYYKKITSFSTA
jgi:hypothetical protein